jgi:hypothetical protein
MSEDSDTQGKDSRYGGFSAATEETQSEESDTERAQDQDESQPRKQLDEGQDSQPEEQSTESHSESSTDSPTAAAPEAVSADDDDTPTNVATNAKVDQTVNGIPLSEIPHRIKYNSVKDGRAPRTIWISEAEISEINNLHNRANDWYNEEVQATDVYLALLRAGLEASDDALHEQLEEIGYGLLDT